MTWRRVWLAAALLGPCCAAVAQVGGSLSVESDERFRGVSLSRGRPDTRLSASLDSPDGAYAGLSLTSVEFDPGRRRASLLGYAGVSGAAGQGAAALRWEAGATGTHVDGDARYDYVEAFARLLGERWSLRFYLSPDYFGGDARTAYAEVDAGWPFAPAWRLATHVGVLRRLGGGGGSADARLGVIARAGEIDLQLAWIGRRGGLALPIPYERRDSAAVLSASWAF